MLRRFAPVALLVCLLAAGCQTQLCQDLDEKGANEIVALLVENGIPAAKSPGGDDGLWNVSVEETDFARAVRLLERSSLPRPRHDSLGDVFAKSGVLSSPVAERARLMYALSEEMSETLSAIDGVLLARVHVVLAENDDLGEEVAPASVSVMIRYNAAPDNPGATLSERTAEIKKLVAGGIPDLAYDKIQVAFFPADLRVSGPVLAPRYATVLGLRVAPGSAGMVWALAAASAVLVVAAAALAALLLQRRRKAEADHG